MPVQFASHNVSHSNQTNRTAAKHASKPLFAGREADMEPEDSFTNTSTKTKPTGEAKTGKVLHAAFKSAFKAGGFGLFHLPFSGWKRDLVQSSVVAILTPMTLGLPVLFWMAAGAGYRFIKTLIKGLRNPDSVLKP